MNESLKRRYARQIAIEEIEEAGQEAICNGKVFIVGCGALGSMVAMQLAGAGVGKIGIADFDTVDVSNLQRQFFFKSSETGKSKAEVIKERIRELNPDIEVSVHKSFIKADEARVTFKEYDVVVDATDNPSSKQMIDLICEEIEVPCVIGGVAAFEGQVTTLGKGGIRYRDYFPEVDTENFLPCSLGGVIGPAAALCASVQSSEVLKIMTGKGELLINKFLTFDLLKNQFKVYES